MTRIATAGLLDAIDEEVVRPVLFVELDFPSGFVRINSTNSELTNPADSNVYTGIGNLGSVSTIEESSNLQANGIQLQLSGVAPGVITAAFEKAQGRDATIWLGLFDSNYVVIANPSIIFQGLIDNASIALGETGTVQLNIENRMIEWQRPKIRRYTDEDQQAAHAGDLFFQFVNQTTDKELFWGAKQRTFDES